MNMLRRPATWRLVLAALFSSLYALILVAALADYFAKGAISNEAVAGLGFLATLPALPLSFLYVEVLSLLGLNWVSAPFENGLATLAAILLQMWLVAIIQWCVLLPLIVPGLAKSKGG